MNQIILEYVEDARVESEIDVLLAIDVSELSSGFLFCLVGIVVVSVIRNGRYTT